MRSPSLGGHKIKGIQMLVQDRIREKDLSISIDETWSRIVGTRPLRVKASPFSRKNMKDLRDGKIRNGPSRSPNSTRRGRTCSE